MEKYSQFRDRGSGIAPFLPTHPPPSGLWLPLHIFLFMFRFPLLVTIYVAYFFALQWLPIGSFGKKAALWCILGVPGLWWVDLQVDGVKRGSLAKQQKTRLPHGGSIIASSMTSPIDAVYLAAIFDPIFTASYPNSRKVEHLSLFQIILRFFSFPQTTPPPNASMVDPFSLLERYPGRPVVIFPECTTTNGRGILPLSHSLVAVPPETKIYPVSVRYTPADVTTPLSGSYLGFLWSLLSRPTHCIHVRIAECIVRSGSDGNDGSSLSVLRKTLTQGINPLGSVGGGMTAGLSPEEKAVLESVGDSLARLGRVRRVGLGVSDKQAFIQIWAKARRN